MKFVTPIIEKLIQLRDLKEEVEPFVAEIFRRYQTDTGAFRPKFDSFEVQKKGIFFMCTDMIGDFDEIFIPFKFFENYSASIAEYKRQQEEKRLRDNAEREAWTKRWEKEQYEILKKKFEGKPASQA